MKHLICDVDGCLSYGRGYKFNLEAIRDLRILLDRNAISLIFASGRSQAYLEAVAQLVDTNTPVICENGAGIYNFSEGRYVYTEAGQNISEVRETLTDLVQGKILFEPCKDFTLSFRLVDELAQSNVEAEFSWLLERFAIPDRLAITHSNSAIDIGPSSASKGEAVKRVASDMGFLVEDAFGFGDSCNDRSFLELVGNTAAPANASTEIRELVDYVCTHKDALGLVEYINHIVEVT